MQPYDPSPSALKTLFGTYWSSRGWHSIAVHPTSADLDLAVEAGVMFREPRRGRHDTWVAEVRDHATRLEPSQVGAAFLVSLSTRRLDLRSALASFAVARHLPDHALEERPNDYATSSATNCCVACGLYDTDTQDRNVLSFERFKWGGVRRDDLTYIAFDLEQFKRAPMPSLDTDDIDLGRRLFTALNSAEPNLTPSRLHKTLSFIGGNKAEREVLLDILAVSGVLETPEHPGHRNSFVRWDEREETGAHFEDRAYSLPWWRGRHGVNTDAVEEWFPMLG